MRLSREQQKKKKTMTSIRDKVAYFDLVIVLAIRKQTAAQWHLHTVMSNT